MSVPTHRRIAGSGEAVFSNEDLLFEILRRVPIRCVIRYKSVCKLWRLIISEPRFVPTSVLGLFLFKDVENIYVGFDFERSRKSVPVLTDALASAVTILDSCRGLLLCKFRSTCTWNCVCVTCASPFYIYNPTTNQSATIPQPPCCNTRTQSFCCASLVVDPYSRQLKVVMVVGFRPEDSNQEGFTDYQIKIYSTETRTWRLSGKPFVSPLLASFTYYVGVYFNGTIHWPPHGTFPSLRFDVDQESLSTMPLSPYPNPPSPNIGYFGESRGHLHLIQFKSLRSTDTVFDVLEMASDYSNWFVKYHINLDQAIIKPGAELGPPKESFIYGTHYGRFSVLDLVREEMEQDSYLVMYVPGKIVSYNFNNNTLVKLADDVAIPHGDIGAQNSIILFGWRCAFRYIETVLQL